MVKSLQSYSLNSLANPGSVVQSGKKLSSDNMTADSFVRSKDINKNLISFKGMYGSSAYFPQKSMVLILKLSNLIDTGKFDLEHVQKLFREDPGFKSLPITIKDLSEYPDKEVRENFAAYHLHSPWGRNKGSTIWIGIENPVYSADKRTNQINIAGDIVHEFTHAVQANSPENENIQRQLLGRRISDDAHNSFLDFERIVHKETFDKQESKLSQMILAKSEQELLQLLEIDKPTLHNLFENTFKEALKINGLADDSGKIIDKGNEQLLLELFVHNAKNEAQAYEAGHKTVGFCYKDRSICNHHLLPVLYNDIANYFQQKLNISSNSYINRTE